MPRDVIDFQPNKPVEVALKYPAGKVIEGKFGKRVMFCLQDGRMMFHDLKFAERINRLELAPGETFFVALKWTGNRGDRREWDCWLSPATEKARAMAEIDGDIPPDEGDVILREKLQDSIIYAEMKKQVASAGLLSPQSNDSGTNGPTPHRVHLILPEKFGPRPVQSNRTTPAATPPDEGDVILREKLQDSIAHGEMKKQPAPVPTPAPQSNGSGTYGPTPQHHTVHPIPPEKFVPRLATSHQTRPAATPVPVKQQYPVAFTEFLIAAGRATKVAETALSQEGASIRFDSRDIAAIATSMFIEAGRKDFLTWTPGGQA